jgi:hypothetical protein
MPSTLRIYIYIPRVRMQIPYILRLCSPMGCKSGVQTTGRLGLQVSCEPDADTIILRLCSSMNCKSGVQTTRRLGLQVSCEPVRLQRLCRVCARLDPLVLCRVFSRLDPLVLACRSMHGLKRQGGLAYRSHVSPSGCNDCAGSVPDSTHLCLPVGVCMV